jgi:flagellum-specific peptidoglycan hydrolase FlgJ
MATFPTAAEIQRPVPQAGTSIPTARPTPYGLEGARAMEVAGQQFQELAVLTDRYAQRLDEADAQDALNKLAEKRAELTADPQKGFARLRGKAAMGDGPDGQPITKSFSAAFDLEREALGSKLSARARRAYDAQATREALGFKIDLVKHQTAQADKYETATYAGAQAMNVNRAAQSADDDRAIGILAGDAGKLARKRAADLGLDGPAADAAAFAAESDVLKAAVTMRIAKGDPSAIGFFEANKDRFDAKDRIGLETSIKTMRTGEEAKGFVAGLSIQGREQFIATITPHALEVAKETGLDPRLVIAQAALETGYGRAAPGNNYFGIKSHGKPGGQVLATTEVGAGGEYKTNESFRTYGSPGESAKDYADFLKSNSRYAPVLAAKGLDAQIDAMAKSGYATDPNYGAKLRQIANSLPASADPLAKQVNAGTATVERDEKKDQGYDYASVGKAEGPPGFLDTRQMKIDAEIWHIEATKANALANKDKPEVARAAQHLIDVQFGQRKAAVQLAKDQLNDAVQDWVTKPDAKTGKPQTERPPPPIWNQLSYEQQRSIDATLKHNAEGTKVATKPDVYYAWVKGLSDPDLAERQKWIDKDLLVDKPNLADEQFRSLADKQATARKGDPDAKLAHGETNTKKGDRRLKEIGILPMTGKPTTEQLERAGDFHLELERKVREQQRAQNNKPLEPEQVDKIIRDLTYEVTGSGGWFDIGKKRAFQVPNPDPAKFVVKMKDIPTSDLAKITEALKAEGIPPTDANVIDRYKRVRLGVKP